MAKPRDSETIETSKTLLKEGKRERERETYKTSQVNKWDKEIVPRGKCFTTRDFSFSFIPLHSLILIRPVILSVSHGIGDVPFFCKQSTFFVSAFSIKLSLFCFVF